MFEVIVIAGILLAAVLAYRKYFGRSLKAQKMTLAQITGAPKPRVPGSVLEEQQFKPLVTPGNESSGFAQIEPVKKLGPERMALREALDKDDQWNDFEALFRETMRRGMYDIARQQLQKIAYTMVSAKPEDKNRFTQVMSEFARQDPLYMDIMATVMKIVEKEPGIKQTQTYKYFPGYSPEEIRYVLYFAHEIGDIFRKKKGNTYQLFPSGTVIDGDKA